MPKRIKATPAPSAPVAETTVFVDREEIVNPSVLLVRPEENIRHSISRPSIEKMKDDIMNSAGGRIETRIVVEELSDEEKASSPGKTYIVRKGNIRTLAAQELNDEGKGVLAPITVTKFTSPLQRITRQIAENAVRRDLTPIDEAVAIKMAMDNGATRQDLMRAFSSPSQDGKRLEPASNSFLNMRLSFLEFPKDIQNRIADGRLNVRGAYLLSTYDKDSWKPMLAKIDADRKAEWDKMKAAEEKLTKNEEAALKAAQDLEELEKKAALAKDLVKSTGEAEKITATEARNAFDGFMKLAGAKKSDAKSKAEETKKATEAQHAAAQTAYTKAKEEADKVQKKLDEAKKKAAEKAAKQAQLEEKRKKHFNQSPTHAELQSAAAATGAKGKKQDNNGPVPANIATMRFFVESLNKLSSVNQPKVKAIAEVLQAALDGKHTDGSFYKAVSIVCNEWKESAKKK